MNLTLISDLSLVLAKAAELGHQDAAHGGPKKGRTGRQLMQALGVRNYRNGHLLPVKMAYNAGRFTHQLAQAQPQKQQNILTT